MEWMHDCIYIFNKAIEEYHRHDDVDFPLSNPYPEGSIENTLYHKCWIDTVQWHLEDIIRDPDIDPAEALALKRRIDRSNQERTDMVESIDDYFLNFYKCVSIKEDAKLNTESPAWAIDRLSILQLKLYHMLIEVNREDSPLEVRQKCASKLSVLEIQNADLQKAIEELLSDIQAGVKYMKSYKQMKMYNDDTLNPVLYGKVH